jgi:thiosulfate/3-mercaptopyruvate sulfurtransferase
LFPTPLVSSAWLADHLGEPGLIVVDASWYLPAMHRDPRAEYLAGHIPGAVFWDIDALSEQATSLPHMLPDPATLARQIGDLGISNPDRVVVYDGSGVNLSAPRVWWTLRVAGHDAVAVLDGGLGKWRAEGRPLESGEARPKPQRFAIRWRANLVRSMQDLRSALGRPDFLLVDARSAGRFAGTEPEPRPGIRGGHVPGAQSLPYQQLVRSDGTMLSPPELAARFTAAGIDPSRPAVTMCGSGVTACALALGLYQLGQTGAAVYDGSWTEWGAPEGPPVDRG